MKKLIIPATLLALIGLGAWLTAVYELGDKLHRFEKDVQSIGPGRGGHAPDEETVEQRILDSAEEHGVEVSDLFVNVEPLSRENMDRAGALTNMVQGKLDESVEKGRENRPTVDSEASEVTNDYLDDRQMEIKGTLIEIELHVHAEKWLWSQEEDFTTSTTLR